MKLIICLLLMERILYVMLQAQLPSKQCKPDLTTQEINCINNELIDVPNIPNIVAVKISKMNLTKNYIRMLHEDTFKIYESLTSLILDSNQLSKITENAFASLENLKYLSLRNNLLAIQPGCLSKMAMTKLTNLEYLDLSENPLGTLRSDFFESLKSLKRLYLEKAVLDLRIEPNALRGLIQLAQLSLANNQFQSLPSHMQNDLLKMPLKSIDLHGNLWRCDCELRWLKSILDKINLSSTNQMTKQPRCFSPQLHKDIELQMLKIDDYMCYPEIYTTSQEITTTQNSNLSLICQTYSNPPSQIEWYKDNVRIQSHWPGLVIWSVGENHVNSTLFIKQAEHGFDDGQYRCQLANVLSKKSTNFTVKIINSGLRKRKVPINQILILVGIGSSIIIILIAIVGIVMYVFMNKSTLSHHHNNMNCGINKKRRNISKSNHQPSDNTEAVENMHFLDSFVEPNNITSSMYSSVLRTDITHLPDINTLINPDSNNNPPTIKTNTNPQLLQQLGLSSTGKSNNNCCPIFIQSPPNPNESSIICPLHGNSSSGGNLFGVKNTNECLINTNSPIILGTQNSPSLAISGNPQHIDSASLINCANDLNNALLGNVGAFYSLERQTNNFNSNILSDSSNTTAKTDNQFNNIHMFLTSNNN